MKEKIKKFFAFVGRAWSGGLHGKIGVLASVFAAFMFIGIFTGDVSIQKFIINIWRLDSEQEQLATEKHKLETMKHHIKLIENYSPDYVQEIGLKYLNMGDPEFKTLKI